MAASCSAKPCASGCKGCRALQGRQQITQHRIAEAEALRGHQAQALSAELPHTARNQAGHQGDGLGAGWPPREDLLLVGLRRREGVDLAWLQQAGHGELDRAWLERVLAGWIARGVVELSAQRLRLVAPEGFCLSNAVLSDLLVALERSAPLAPTGARLG